MSVHAVIEYMYIKARRERKKANSFENTYPHILADKTTAKNEFQNLNSKFI